MPSGEGGFEEVYEDWVIDEKIPDETFRVPVIEPGAMIRALKGEDSLMAMQAEGDLSELGVQEAYKLVGVLGEGLDDKKVAVRLATVRALGRIGSAGNSERRRLTEGNGSDGMESGRGTFSPRRDMFGTTSAVSHLAKAMKDSDAGVRRSAAAALGRFGAEAGRGGSIWTDMLKSSVDALSPAVKDKDGSVRRAATLALWE